MASISASIYALHRLAYCVIEHHQESQLDHQSHFRLLSELQSEQKVDLRL